MPPTACALFPNKHTSGRIQQSVRQPRSNSKPTAQDQTRRFDQTNDPVCRMVALLFKQRADWLCTLLFIAVFKWERNRLCEGQKAQGLWASQGWVAPRFTMNGQEVCTRCYYPALLTCPLWIMIPMRAAINHFYCNGNIHCDCLPFFWQMSLS